MTFNDYQSQAITTKVYGYGQKIVYPALGLANEAGEVVGKVKKMLRDDEGKLTDERKAMICSELGDVLWYIAALADDLELPMNDIANENLAKVFSRRERNAIKGDGDNR